jgi:hypothetical protein
MAAAGIKSIPAIAAAIDSLRSIVSSIDVIELASRACAPERGVNGSFRNSAGIRRGACAHQSAKYRKVPDAAVHRPYAAVHQDEYW